jgi:hypothetical protein
VSEELLRISVDGGKYTVIQPRHEQVRIERHGEPWMGPGFAGSNAVLALAYELEEAREKLAAVTGAARKLYMAGKWCAGLPANLEARMWEDLRDALGLEPGTATALGFHDERLPAHGCPACDDAMECTCEPPLPMFDGDEAAAMGQVDSFFARAAAWRP